MTAIHTRSLGILRLAAAVCAITVLHVGVASAGIRPEPFRTGLFGVTAGQSIRISILNAGDAGGIIDACFHVWDATGRLLFETSAGPLPGGSATFADFTPVPEDGIPAGTRGRAGRVQLRAEIVFSHDLAPRDPLASRVGALRRQRSVLVTLEVFDTATGQTAFTMPFAAVAGIDPQPFAPVAGVDSQPFTPPFLEVAGINPQPFRTGLFGVTERQAIRVSVLNAGEAGGIIEPCVRVFDLDGVLLFEMEGGPIAGGAGAFADFDPLPPDPTRAPGLRAQLRVEVELVPAVYPPDPVAAPRVRRGDIHLSLEVFDTTTGQTVYTMPFSWVGFNPQPEPPEPIAVP